MAKTPKGELTAPELRKLIRAHNILVSIKIPKGTDREGLIKLIEDKGYKVDHKNKKILDAKKDRPRRPKVTLEEAKELTKPKPKTALQQQKIAEAKAEKEEKKKKEVRAIKKEAIKEEKARSKPRSKPKKEDEVRPKEKVGRPKVDPKKIKVIEPNKKEEPKKEEPLSEKSFGASKLSADELKKLIDSLGLDSRFRKRLQTIGGIRSFLRDVVSGGDFFNLKKKINEEEFDKLPFHIKSFYDYPRKIGGVPTRILLNENVSKKELVSKIKSFLKK